MAMDLERSITVAMPSGLAVKGDWLIRLPARIGTSQAMAIGTAGYTAMLCVLVLEHAGVTPDRGPVLVTGAAGGGAQSRSLFSTNSVIT